MTRTTKKAIGVGVSGMILLLFITLFSSTPVRRVMKYRDRLVDSVKNANGDWRNFILQVSVGTDKIDAIKAQTNEDYVVAVFGFDGKNFTIDFLGGSIDHKINGSNDSRIIEQARQRSENLKAKLADDGLPFSLKKFPLAICMPYDELKSKLQAKTESKSYLGYMGIEPPRDGMEFDILTICMLAEGVPGEPHKKHLRRFFPLRARETWPEENFVFYPEQQIIWP